MSWRSKQESEIDISCLSGMNVHSVSALSFACDTLQFIVS